MSLYMLLLHEKPFDFTGYSPEEIQKIIMEYVAWRNKVEAAGKLVSANKLEDGGGRHLTLSNGKIKAIDGPYTESHEVVGGYFVIEASSYGEAEEIAGDCPHLKYGGRIEVRKTEQTA